MGATSVTGVSGPGDSGGLYKPELQCGGCGCGSKDEPEPAEAPSKIGCYVRSKTGGVTTSRTGGGITSRGC